MTQAGYPNGFELTIVCTAGRFMRDKEVCEAVAAMLAQIRVKATVQAVPFAVHTQMRLTKELNFFRYSGGTGWGEILSTFIAVAPTPDTKLRLGSANSNNYSNPEVDKLLIQATRTIDNNTRWAIRCTCWRRPTRRPTTWRASAPASASTIRWPSSFGSSWSTP